LYTGNISGALPQYERAEALKLLIVDDSSADVFLFRQLIEGVDDVRIEISHTAEYGEGLSDVRDGRFDIAFVDYVLGKNTGPELIAEAGGRLCPTPLVLLTGQSGPNAEQLAIQAGAVDFVDKGTLTSDLLRRVIRYARYNHNSARELALTQERYRYLAESAIEANTQKSRFFAEMSHELRTPLNAIIGFSEIMKEQMLGALSGDALDRYLEYTDDIHTSSRHLLSLINDLLDLSKMEAGQYPTDRQEVSFTDIAERLVKMVRIQAENAEIRLEVDVEKGLPKFLADGRLLLQALLNIVSNGLKFTEAGGEVRMEAEMVEDHISISVRDTGVGIPEKDLEAVLLPYRQGSTLESRPGGGTGLGLTLAKSIIELHGGGITISSAPGVGTTVLLRLPYQPGTHATS
jgi:signal transduction histidine kinase